jgi:hypothetical protein
MSFLTDLSPRALQRWVIAWAACVLAGCAPLKPAAPVVVVAVPAPDPAVVSAIEADQAFSRLLAYGERVRDLAPADLAREVQRLGEPADSAGKLELALLLAQTRQSGDLPRALAMLEPLARLGAAAPWQGLARLLQPRLAEQRRQEEQIDRQGQQLREQQRRMDQLTSQIDALRAIERSLNTRPAGLPAAPAAAAPAPTTPPAAAGAPGAPGAAGAAGAPAAIPR